MPALSNLCIAKPAAPAPDGAGPAIVIQLARLGDFLQTTPLLAALGEKHSPLMVVVTPAQAPLVRACGLVDGVSLLDPATVATVLEAETEPLHLRAARLRGLLAPVWAEEVGTVYNLNLSFLAAGVARGWPGAKVNGWRLDSQGGLEGEKWAPFIMALVGDRRLTRLHLSDILASYAQPAGPPLKNLAFLPNREARAQAAVLLPSPGSRVVLQLGANNRLRRWPLASFVSLARGLLDRGLQVVLTGSSSEAYLAKRLQKGLGSAGDCVTNLMGRTSLGALGAVLAGSSLAVSADTGTLHLATAAGARVLALFMGPAQVHETGPYGEGHLVLQARDRCGPCQENNPACSGQAPCRNLIAPEQALRAAVSLLEGASASEAAMQLQLPSGVEALASQMDGFGQTYQIIKARTLTVADGLGLGLRQAGRILLRPNYNCEIGDIREELSSQFLAGGARTAAQLNGLASASAALSRAVWAGDHAGAARILDAAPGLNPLGILVGRDRQPARLAQACTLCAEVLAAASAL